MEQLFFDFITDLGKDRKFNKQEALWNKGKRLRVLYKYVTGLALYLIGFMGFITLIVIIYSTLIG